MAENTTKNKQYALVVLLIVTLTGAFVNFYTTNLCMSDVANLTYGFQGPEMIASWPGFFFSVDFVLAILYIFRVFKHPEYRVSLNLFYLHFLGAVSALGFLSSIATGLFVYHTFTAIYPFPGYTILGLVIHGGLGIFGFVKARKIKKSLVKKPETHKIHIGYVFYTAILSVFLFFALDRLGALLWLPAYVQIRTLNLTWPFYLTLLIPVAILAHMILYTYGFDKTRPRFATRYLTVILLVNTVLCIYLFGWGLEQPQLISAVSPAFALERLASWPCDSIIQFGACFLFGFYFLSHAIWKEKKVLGK